MPARHDDDTPGWAVALIRDFTRELGQVNARLSRIEGGLALAGVIVGVVAVLMAAHVIVLHLS